MRHADKPRHGAGMMRVLRWVLLWVLLLIAVIASALVQVSFENSHAYRAFVEMASRIGERVLIVAIVVLVADMAALVIYTIRHGESDRTKGKVFVANRPLRSMSLGYGPLMGWSKVKSLGGKRSFVTMESLVDGSATLAERMMVVGIVAVFIAFFSIFLGVGLILMKRLAILVLFPVVPGLFVLRAASEAWKDYRAAKKKIAARAAEPVETI